jgi:hypothetical protein
LTLVFTAFLATHASAQNNPTAPDPMLETGTDTVTVTVTDANSDGAVADVTLIEEVVMDVMPDLVLTPLNAADVTLDEFQWIKRPIVVFADTPADPRFQEQMTLLLARPEPLIERDVVIIIDTDPRAKSAARQTLRPHGFMLTLIGKDGGVVLRKPFPWDVREITRSIDKMPIRKQEIRDQNERAAAEAAAEAAAAAAEAATE